MTRQREVIGAFFRFENEPNRASNFRMVTLGEGGHTAFLVGGNDGREMVIAKREPLYNITVYGRRYGLYRRCTLRNRGGEKQVGRVLSFARTHSNSVEADVTVNSDTKPKPVDEFEELEI